MTHKFIGPLTSDLNLFEGEMTLEKWYINLDDILMFDTEDLALYTPTPRNTDNAQYLVFLYVLDDEGEPIEPNDYYLVSNTTVNRLIADAATSKEVFTTPDIRPFEGVFVTDQPIF